VPAPEAEKGTSTQSSDKTTATDAAKAPEKPTPAEIKSNVPAPVETKSVVVSPTETAKDSTSKDSAEHAGGESDNSSLMFVFMLATFIGLGVILRVSGLLHTPLMSLTNAISAIAVVGSIIVTGDANYPMAIRWIGAVALFASMTNIVSGFLITDR